MSSKKEGFLPSTLCPQNWPIQATTNRTRDTQKTLAPLSGYQGQDEQAGQTENQHAQSNRTGKPSIVEGDANQG